MDAPRRRRLVVVLAVVAAAAAAALAVALLRGSDDPGGPRNAEEALAQGNPVRGGDVYVLTCTECHGLDAEGHTGPPLNGNPISIPDAREAIRNGTENMPGGLVSGDDERDLLAFLATILAAQPES